MLTQNLYRLFKSFNKEEIKSFRRFLKSPYFNQNEKLINLYDKLCEYHPTFQNENLNNRSLYSILYRSKFKDSTMRNLFFRLSKLGEKFLIFENLKRNEFEKQNLLLNQLNRKRQKCLYVKTERTIKKMLNNNGFNKEDFYLNKYIFETNNFNFLCIHKSLITKKNIQEQLASLNKATIKLTIFSIIELISKYLNGDYYTYTFKISKDLNLAFRILKCININEISEILKEDNEDYSMIILYESLLLAYSNFEEDKYYFKYRNNLNNQINLLSKSEIVFHYSKLIAYCIMKMNEFESGSNFKPELFSIYRELLKNKYYKDEKVNELPHNLFRAILFHSINIKEINWVKEFIEEYSKEVEATSRDNMYRFGFAFYYYEIKNYEQSLEFARQISVDYFLYKYDIKSLLLRIYYDTNCIDKAYDLIHSYKELLRIDDNINPEIKVYHQNFLRYYEKLLNHIDEKSNIDIEYLKEEVINNNRVMLKSWLIKAFDLIISTQKKVKYIRQY